MTTPGCWIVGVDESGKGDFFGPLVVAAFLSHDSEEEHLKQVGVRDSKLISDKRIIEIDSLLREHYPHSVIVMDPEEYNVRYADIKNLNKLLADCHAQVMENVLKENQVDLAVSDKFGKSELIEQALSARGMNVNLKQIVRGEKIISVAAASILARASFLRNMRELSDRYDIEIPKGAAAQVDAAGREIVRRLGPDILPKLAKTHFKNYGRVVKPTLFT